MSEAAAYSKALARYNTDRGRLVAFWVKQRGGAGGGVGKCVLAGYWEDIFPANKPQINTHYLLVTFFFICEGNYSQGLQPRVG